MASRVLYPPIVDSYMPAFNANDKACRIYFSLSKFNSSTDMTSVQATVVKQSTGMSVVNTTDGDNRYRSTGIILNIPFTQVSDNLFYIEIRDVDLSPKSSKYKGWIPGWIYKVQLRLSSVNYAGDSGVGQSSWLNSNASNFSEWSTICVIKATGNINYTIPALNFDSSQLKPDLITYYASTLDLAGHFEKEDTTELIKSYQFILYDGDGVVIEDSGTILINQYQDNNSFTYLFKTEVEDKKEYKLGFKFETINHYVGGNYEYDEESGVDKRIPFVVSQVSVAELDAELVTADNDPYDILTDITSVYQEEEEGRIGLKIYSPASTLFSGNICIRRSDSRDNFKVWRDIKIVTIRQSSINSYPVIYDYTVESGVWYKYGIQEIDKNGNRGILTVIKDPIMRNFEYSFILGKNNQQLKLMFDNAMGSYKFQVAEGKQDPIGSIYPNVARNAATKYKIFPVTGLISFWMDENTTFISKKEIYKEDSIIELYDEYNEEKNITQYDYIFEKDFRDKVLDFLYDGELKLFKSPTEGNVIVRLMDISCVPNQSVDRMIYSFSATALQMAESTMENYLKYGFYDPGTWATDFSVYVTYLGQLQEENFSFSSPNDQVKNNLFAAINAKYGSNGRNLGGYTKEVGDIKNVRINFDGEPLRYYIDGEYILGYAFNLNGDTFIIKYPFNVYEFDSRLIYKPTSTLIFLPPADSQITGIPITVDFLYTLRSEKYEPKQIQSISSRVLAGQLFKEVSPNENIYNDIYYKYYVEWDTISRTVNKITSIEIETNPGAVFEVKDKDDSAPELHVVGDTGQLRLYEINDIVGFRYVGIQNPDGTIDRTKKTNAMINYIFTLALITYKQGSEG